MKAKYFSPLLMLVLFLTAASCKKGNDDEKGFSNAEVNEWLYEGMQAVYLWNDFIPSGINPMTSTNPLSFFESMIYKDEDRWSWSTDDYPSLMAELQGTPTSFGISPSFGLYSSTNNVVIAIEYVYPGSPAADAGMKRGDIIVKIDGQELRPTNYYSLYNQSSINAQLGSVDENGVNFSGDNFNLTKEVIESNPVIYHGILDINGIKTGYLVYSEFISGINDKFMNELGTIFNNFESEGITELIVDLRYNPGGEIDMASFLASAIAPEEVISNGDVLVRYLYNDELQDYFINQSETDQIELKFENNPNNIDLDRVFFLTTGGTASASELVITGLEPYMEVVHIGETTRGKYTGAWVIPDTEEPVRHNYAMIPIVLKYSNSQGFTNFKDGLTPDHEIEENILNLKEFGDLSDAMLGKAVELIAGLPALAPKKTIAYPEIKILEDKHHRLNNNLYLPAGEIPVKSFEFMP